MIKMLFFDLDDTLLNSDKNVSPRVLEALRRVHDLGIKIGYVTARTKWSADKVIRNLPIDAVAYCSGASVHCDGKQVFESAIPGKQGKEILDRFSDEFPERSAFTVFGPYTHFTGGELWKDGFPCDEKESDVRGSHGYRRIVLLNTSWEEMVGVAGEGVTHVMTRYSGLAITASDIGKGHAAKTIADHYGVNITETAAFGDDTSDFDMLRTCGIGVAMENAVYEVKSVADYITGSHDSDGVAEWIERYILNEL